MNAQDLINKLTVLDLTAREEVIFSVVKDDKDLIILNADDSDLQIIYNPNAKPKV